MKHSVCGKYETGLTTFKSYPNIAFWNEDNPMEEEWEILVQKIFKQTNETHGISLNINLPFCERLCTFCAFSPYITTNHSQENPYIEHLQKEWFRYFQLFKKKPVIKRFHLGGGTPTFFSPSNLKGLIEFIKRYSIISDQAELSCEINMRNTTTGHLYTLRHLGFQGLVLGVQDFDPGIQKTINKIQPFEAVFDLVQRARYIGFSNIGIDLAYGLPNQSRKTIINTIYKIRELKPDQVTLYDYLHCPEKSPSQKKFENQLPLTPEKNIFFTLAKEMLLETGYVHIGMNKFVLKSHSLYPAFLNRELYYTRFGYSKHHTPLSIGLGVNAISDAWYAFVKNTGKLSGFYQQLNQNKFAFEKGFFLSKKDLVIRKHIQNLLTRFETSWNNSDECHAVLEEGIEKLKQFKKDNLVEITARGLKIKKAGRAFVMDICHLIDYRLWNYRQQKISA